MRWSKGSIVVHVEGRGVIPLGDKAGSEAANRSAMTKSRVRFHWLWLLFD